MREIKLSYLKVIGKHIQTTLTRPTLFSDNMAQAEMNFRTPGRLTGRV